MTENQLTEHVIILNSIEELSSLFGAQDKLLIVLESGLQVTINYRGEEISIQGESDAVLTAATVIEKLIVLIRKGIKIDSSDVLSAIKMAQRGTLDYFTDLYAEELIRDHQGRVIRVKNFGQRQYIKAIKEKDVVFGIGPAGTGKTFLAVVMAIAALKRGEVQKIILTRPAVEAGESLGFLPGDLKEKVDPYLRPVYDALYQIYGSDQTERLMERGVIEIAPLAYMRGRTLDDAFVILDEAQNTTPAQMKMFLTRLGFGSKMIVNGDKTQIDLPHHTLSGLIQAEKLLKKIDSIEFVTFQASDVVRHPVVAQIIEAYDQTQGEN